MGEWEQRGRLFLAYQRTFRLTVGGEGKGEVIRGLRVWGRS